MYLNEGKSADEIVANNGPQLNGVATNATLRMHASNVVFFNGDYSYWLLPMTKYVSGWVSG